MRHKADRTEGHQALLTQTMLAIGSQPTIRCWKQHRGVYMTLDGRAHVSVGVPGWADIGGIYRVDGCPHAHFFQGECKTGSGQIVGDQARWRAFCDRFGILHVEVRDPSDMVQALVARGAMAGPE